MESNYGIFVSKTDEGFYIVTLPGAKVVLESNDFFVLDVRPYGLFAPFNIEEAINISTIGIPDRLDEIPQDRKILIYYHEINPYNSIHCGRCDNPLTSEAKSEAANVKDAMAEMMKDLEFMRIFQEKLLSMSA